MKIIGHCGGGDKGELASSLPQTKLLQRSTVVRQLRLRSPSPRVLQEEGGHHATPGGGGGGAARVEEELVATAAVEGEVAAVEEEVPAATTVEGEVATTTTTEEEIAAATAVPDVDMEHDGSDATEGGDHVEEHLMQQFLTEELDPVVGGFTPGVARGLGLSPLTRWSGSNMGTYFNFDISIGAPPSCSRAAWTDRATSRDEATGKMGTQTSRESTVAESPDAARDIMKRERARLMASSDLRAQAFARALEERKRR
ncbi:hypothetical protein CBR_g34250 [Chara braunii]|uniref:Uncharacterized protein n=1 Tax=Chara braunii TaxID=69332 RepID=A0A388JYL2_CHABU|nr:hypothetical protein CBR_g34250 [Chara braunii]|eukprot:GBG62878.1 hypothetical protein CBR_g34250 [Chara braunii]